MFHRKKFRFVVTECFHIVLRAFIPGHEEFFELSGGPLLNQLFWGKWRKYETQNCFTHDEINYSSSFQTSNFSRRFSLNNDDFGMISRHAINEEMHAPPQMFHVLFSVYSAKSIKQQLERFPIEHPLPHMTFEMNARNVFKCFLVFTKWLGCNLLHDEVPSGHNSDYLSQGVPNDDEWLVRTKNSRIFHAHNKLRVEKVFRNNINPLMTLIIHFA